MLQPRIFLLPLLLFAGLMLLAANTHAERSDYFVDLWTSDDDLPDSSVTSMAQTSDGYLWIGTYNGLARFDGIRFTTFDPANTPQLKHARIAALFTDPRGTLWISTADGAVTSFRDGVFNYEWQSGGQMVSAFFESNHTYLATLSSGVAYGTASGATNHWQTLLSDQPHSANFFGQDASGKIWCVMRDGKIKWISGTNVLSFPEDAGLHNEKANSLATDRTGHIWVGTDTRILRWDGNRFENATPPTSETITNVSFLFCVSSNDFWAFVNDSVRHAVNGQWVQTINSWRDLLQINSIYVGAYREQNGGVWFRSYGQGLFHAGADGKIERITSATGLPGDRVSAWFQDREGNIWIGVDHGGLVRLRKRPFQVVGSGDNFAVATICEDDQNNVWLGTFGSGLNRWRDGRLEPFPLPKSASRNAVLSAYPDARGRVWLSVDHEDLFILESNRITRSEDTVHGIKCILADHEGRVWLGRQYQLTCWTNGEFLNYAAANGFERRDVRALAEDHHGNLWIGTGNGVLYKLADGKFTVYKPADASEGQAIWSLLPDNDDTLWVGTFRGGLLRFKDGQFTRFTTRNGLPGDIISQILDDGLGKLWFGSHKGIFYIPKSAFAAFDHGEIKLLPCVSFGLYDGMPTLECTGNFQPAAWRTHDGKLWFATVKGAVTVDPTKVRPNRVPPPVVIEEFLLDGKVFPLSSRIQIPPGKHQFDFQFTAPSFTAPDKVRFRYRLAGLDNSWVEAGTKRTAHYGPLPPGDYKLQVIACNNVGVWNDIGATVALEQLPFFWQTSWFIVTAIFAGVLCLTLAVRYVVHRSMVQKLERLKQQRAIERERERIGRDLHDDLGAGLTQIMLQSSLARQETPEKMRGDLTQISENSSELVRAMDEILWAINPENDTLDDLVTYMAQYVQEFLTAAKIRCRLDLPAQTPGVTVSAETRHNLFLAIKEALNNAVKHACATEVLFQLKVRDHAFSFVIKDNGAGFVPGEKSDELPDPQRISSGHGLKNLARRLEQIGGSCTIASEPGQGTRVELSIPTQNHRRHELK